MADPASKSPIDFADYIATLTDDFTGREWVFREIDFWRKTSSTSPYFLVVGEPGCGKSAIAARLAQFSAGGADPPSDSQQLAKGFLSAIYFCRASDSDCIDPRTFAESISLQLAAIPEFALALKDVGDKTININVQQRIDSVLPGANITMQGVSIENLILAGVNGKEVFSRTVLQPLRTIYSKGYSRPIVILVDSLDEALTSTTEITIVDLLAGTQGVNKQIQFILTSRLEPSVRNKFLHATELSLDDRVHANHNNEDILEYVKYRLQNDDKLKSQVGTLSFAHAAALPDLIIRKAEGNFQYVVFLLKAASEGHQNLEYLSGLPAGLDGLYYSSLDRVIKKGKKDWATAYKPLLGVLSVAQEPVALSQVQVFSGLRNDVHDMFVDLRQFIELAPESKPPTSEQETEERYRLYHQSIIDFLRRRKLVVTIDSHKKILDNIFSLAPEDWHKRIANYYWETCQTDWSRCDAYALRHLAGHLSRSPGTKHELTAALKTLLLDFTWLRRKLQLLDVSSLLLDYEYLSEDAVGNSLKDALRLSAHVLRKDPAQLASQLLGRLVGKNLEIRRLLRKAKQTTSGFWFRPLTASLHRTGDALLSKLTGHTDYVGCLVLTDDGSTVVSGSGDSTARVWDMTTAEERYKLEGHTAPVTALAITPDGRMVVSGSIDCSVRVWNLQHWKRPIVFTGHTGAINAVAVTPDGRRAVSASEDGTLRVHDLLEGAFLYTLAGHEGSVHSVAITPDGQKAVSGSKDGTLKVWGLPSGRLVHTLGAAGWSAGKTITLPDGRTGIYFRDGNVPALWDRESRQVLRQFVGHVEEVTALALTPDSRRAISGSRDATLRVWDLEMGVEQRILIGHKGYIYDVAVAPNGQLAASVSSDGTVRVWDLEVGSCLYSLAGHDSDVFCLAFTRDGQGIATGSGDETVRFWDLKRGEERTCLRGHTETVREVAVTPDGRKAISASNDKSLHIWDLTVVPAAVTSRHLAQVNAVALTPDGLRAVTASGAQSRSRGNDNTLIVWDAVTGKALHTLTGHSDYVWAASITSDGKRAVSGCGDGSLRVWDLERGELVHSLVGHTETIWDMQITPDGRQAVSASGDHTLIVWDLEQGQPLRRLYGHEDWVNRVVVFADGRRVASSSKDGRIKIWDLEEGKEMLTLSGHSDQAFALALHPDGRRLLSGGGDNAVRIWDLENGRELRVLEGHTSVITGIAITADGRCAISASGYGDCTLRVWDLENGVTTQVLRGHGAYVIAVAALPVGKYAVSASLDGSIRLWELAAGKELAAFVGESSFRSCSLAVQAHTGGMIAVVGEESGRVHFLHLEGNYELRV